MLWNRRQLHSLRQQHIRYQGSQWILSCSLPSPLHSMYWVELHRVRCQLLSDCWRRWPDLRCLQHHSLQRVFRKPQLLYGMHKHQHHSGRRSLLPISLPCRLHNVHWVQLHCMSSKLLPHSRWRWSDLLSLQHNCLQWLFRKCKQLHSLYQQHIRYQGCQRILPCSLSSIVHHLHRFELHGLYRQLFPDSWWSWPDLLGLQYNCL